jgi:hypothetical protein
MKKSTYTPSPREKAQARENHFANLLAVGMVMLISIGVAAWKYYMIFHR